MNASLEQYVVRCRVSGGVTGTRESLLKDNGCVRIFDDKSEAQSVADELQDRYNGNPHRCADFRYWVEKR